MHLRQRFTTLAIVLLYLPLASWVSAASEIEQPIMPLPEDLIPQLKGILEGALKQSPQMIQQDLAVAGAKAGKLAADAAYYPKISASGTDGNSRTQTIDKQLGAGPPTKQQAITYSVSGYMAIFQWGAIRATTDIASLTLKVAQKQYAETYRALAVAIRQQYLQLVSYRGSLRLAELSHDRAKKNLALAEERVKDGVIASGDLLGQRMALEDSRLAVEQARLSFEHYMHMFMALAGLKEFVAESLPESLPEFLYVPDIPRNLVQSYLQGGPEKSYQGQIYVYQIEQARLAYHRALVGQLPIVALSSSYGLGNTSQFVPDTSLPPDASGNYRQKIQQIQTKSTFYGLIGSWNVFDGFATQAAVHSALTVRRTAENTLRNFVDNNIEVVTNAEQTVKIAAGYMKQGLIRKGLAKSAVDTTREDVEFGTVSKAGLEDAEYTYTVSSLSALSLQIEFLNRWSEFISNVLADPALNRVPYVNLKRDAK